MRQPRLGAIARLPSDAQTFVGVAARTGAGPSAGARWRPAPRRAASTSVVMYAVVTATIISGPTASPADDVSSSAMTTEESGRRSIDTQAALISTATAGVSESPGRWSASSPATVPRNSAGNVGPPRKLPSEMLQATPLNSSNHANTDRDTVGASLTSAP